MAFRRRTVLKGTGPVVTAGDTPGAGVGARYLEFGAQSLSGHVNRGFEGLAENTDYLKDQFEEEVANVESSQFTVLIFPGESERTILGDVYVGGAAYPDTQENRNYLFTVLNTDDNQLSIGSDDVVVTQVRNTLDTMDLLGGGSAFVNGVLLKFNQSIPNGTVYRVVHGKKFTRETLPNDYAAGKVIRSVTRLTGQLQRILADIKGTALFSSPIPSSIVDLDTRLVDVEPNYLDKRTGGTVNGAVTINFLTTLAAGYLSTGAAVVQRDEELDGHIDRALDPVDPGRKKSPARQLLAKVRNGGPAKLTGFHEIAVPQDNDGDVVDLLRRFLPDVGAAFDLFSWRVDSVAGTATLRKGVVDLLLTDGTDPLKAGFVEDVGAGAKGIPNRQYVDDEIARQKTVTYTVSPLVTDIANFVGLDSIGAAIDAGNALPGGSVIRIFIRPGTYNSPSRTLAATQHFQFYGLGEVIINTTVGSAIMTVLSASTYMENITFTGALGRILALALTNANRFYLCRCRFIGSSINLDGSCDQFTLADVFFSMSFGTSASVNFVGTTSQARIDRCSFSHTNKTRAISMSGPSLTDTFWVTDCRFFKDWIGLSDGAQLINARIDGCTFYDSKVLDASSLSTSPSALLNLWLVNCEASGDVGPYFKLASGLRVKGLSYTHLASSAGADIMTVDASLDVVISDLMIRNIFMADGGRALLVKACSNVQIEFPIMRPNPAFASLTTITSFIQVEDACSDVHVQNPVLIGKAGSSSYGGFGIFLGGGSGAQIGSQVVDGVVEGFVTGLFASANVSDLDMDGLEVRSCQTSSSTAGAVSLQAPRSKISNCSIHDCSPGFGLYVGTAIHLTMSGNHIYGNRGADDEVQASLLGILLSNALVLLANSSRGVSTAFGIFRTNSAIVTPIGEGTITILLGNGPADPAVFGSNNSVFFQRGLTP